MPPKKKKGGGADAETEEEIARNFSRFKLEYKKQCELLGVPPVEAIERVPYVERVQWLAVHGQNIGPVGASAVACAVQSMDPKFLKVNRLTIYKCDLQDRGAETLAGLLRNQYGIEQCDLPENDIGWEGINEIGLALKANNCLKTLTLDYNPLGDEGAAALADGLRWNGCLDVLSLTYCGIGCYGAGALAQDVVANEYCTLTELNLKGNELGPEGVAAIADSLKVNTSLQTLNLADCGMSNSAISRDAMREALWGHPTLTALDLNLNAIGVEGGQMLLEVLSVNTNIVKCGVFERLGVMYRDIQDKVAENGGKKKKGKKKKKKK